MSLIPDNVEKRLQKLKETIERHRYLYHVLDKPEMSEAALDSLKHELTEIEAKYPESVTPDSPSQRVGGKPLPEFVKVFHEVPQWSFNDAFTSEEMLQFDARVKRFLRTETGADSAPSYVCEHKIDGLKIVLEYKKGLLFRAATRGDGAVGEDVTANVKTIESVPLRMRPEGKFSKGPIEIRGEAIITKKNFDAINLEQKKKGEPAYANSRNLAAGSLRQLDPKITAARKLDFFAYDMVGTFEDGVHSAEHQALRACGFKTGDAIEKMITISDNYSALLISSRSGTPSVANFLKGYGFSGSNYKQPPQTTAKDIAAFYEKLYKGDVVNKYYSMEMLEILKRQSLNDRIPKYLPENLEIAHKTGELFNSKHDAGIVFSKKGDYMIVVLSDTDDPNIAAEKIANLSKAIYEYFSQE